MREMGKRLKAWGRRIGLEWEFPVVLLLVLLLVGVVAVVVVVPAWEAQDVTEVKDRIAAVNDGRRTLGQIAGGVFLAFGLWLTWQNVVIAREGKITDRFSKAVEQLGHERLAVKLGGIYSLERIALDSPKDHWTIVEVLTAYVRQVAHWSAPEGYRSGVQLVNSREPENWSLIAPSVTADVQAILTVLGRRKWRDDQGTVDLTCVSLRNVTLNAAHLAGFNFSGSNLEGALLTKATLEGITAHFTWFDGAILNGANLRRAVLRSAQLREVEANDDAHLEHANLRDADLTDATFRRSHLDNADFTNARMFGTRLDGASLRGAELGYVRGLRSDALANAFVNGETKMPKPAEVPKTEGSNPGA
jgi:uncharacterized protein YjbI with pentapeptide repeats